MARLYRAIAALVGWFALGLQYGLGDGLIGQAALERKRISVQQVPDDFFGVHSALGEAQPRHLVAVPLLLKDRLLGVFEFGTFGHFNATQEAFIDSVLPTVALGENTAVGRSIKRPTVPSG